MSFSSNFPTVMPSLLLDFANTKVLDPRITLTRASTATFYDGLTVAKAEENLLTYSQEFDNAVWAKTNATVTANAVSAPDGTTTADAINGSAGSAYILEALTVTSGVTYTFSVYAKSNTTNFLQIAGGSSGFGANVWANFDLSGGTVGTTGASTTASIQSVGSGWYRCVITGAATASISPGNIFALIPVESSSASRFPTNAGTTSVYVWGAQFEQRSAVTAYTATTTQLITNYIPALRTAAAGVARYDHNPTTGESQGLLIEEQRANLLTYSEQFDNAAWTKGNASASSNVIVAPDGTLTGDKLVEDTATTVHYFYRTAIVAASTAYSISIYAKAAERSRFQIAGAAGAWGATNTATFDVSSGTVVSFSGWSSASITLVGNGWYRCVVNGTTAASPTSAQYIQLVAIASGTTQSYTGDGYSGIYLWGAQQEAGAFATSYIPTVASSVTRAADSASMTGTNFSSWYRADEGTMYAEYAIAGFNPAAANAAFSVSDNSTSNFIVGRITAPNVVDFSVRVLGVNQANITASNTATANTFLKFAGAYKVNDFAASANGLTAVTDTSGTVPTVDRALIGATGNATTNPLNGRIRKLAYYPWRLTNAQLQALTS